MLVVTNLHSTIAVSCYGAIVGALLAWRREWRRLVTVFVCVAGGLTLNVLMKLAFHRARPVLDDPLLTLASYSFPSGHVAGSTIVYGLIVAWTFARTRRTLVRASVVAGAGAGDRARRLHAHVPRRSLPQRRRRRVRRRRRLARALPQRVDGVLAACALAARRRSARRAVAAHERPRHEQRHDRHRQRRLGRRQRQRARRPPRRACSRRQGCSATIELAHGGDEIAAAVEEGDRGAAAHDRRRRRRRHGQLGRRRARRQRHRARRASARHAQPLRERPRRSARARRRRAPCSPKAAPARVDVGEVNGRVFVNNSSLGLYPDIVRDRERQQKRLGRGKWPALAWATIAALRRYPFLGVQPRGRRQGRDAAHAVRLHRQQRIHDGRLRDRRALGARRRPAEPLRRAAARPLAPAPARAARAHRPPAPGARLRRPARHRDRRRRAGDAACASPPTARSP